MSPQSSAKSEVSPTPCAVLELELIQTYMAQEPMLRVEVGVFCAGKQINPALSRLPSGHKASDQELSLLYELNRVFPVSGLGVPSRIGR